VRRALAFSDTGGSGQTLQSPPAKAAERIPVRGRCGAVPGWYNGKRGCYARSGQGTLCRAGLVGGRRDPVRRRPLLHLPLPGRCRRAPLQPQAGRRAPFLLRRWLLCRLGCRLLLPRARRFPGRTKVLLRRPTHPRSVTFLRTSSRTEQHLLCADDVPAGRVSVHHGRADRPHRLQHAPADVGTRAGGRLPCRCCLGRCRP
jgi:hypothetical protein